MIRHALAPLAPPAARSLGLPRTLAELRSQVGVGDGGVADGVALTFDDGPHPEGTPAILEILARHEARATFFVVGEQVERRPEVVRETIAAGHEVALHGYRHRLQLRRTAEAIAEDFARGTDALAAVTGSPPRFHRAPFGLYSAAGLRTARACRLQPVLWSRWGRDWRRFITPQGITRRITEDMAAGDVILLHDADFYSAEGSHRRTAAALELVLAELHARGLGTVSLV